MRFDPEEAVALAAELATPRRTGSPEALAAAARLEALLREAGYRVERSGSAGPVEPTVPPVGFALAAAAAGFVLEGLHRLGHPSGPRELAIACGVLVVVGLVERRFQLGSWRGTGAALPALHATDPRSDGAPARLVIATPLETPTPAATRWLGRVVATFQALWLALLWLPCLLGDARAWLSLAGPGLLATLGLIALLPALDPWTRRPRPYPGDNRSGPALAVVLARAWPEGLARRVALDVRIESPEGFPPRSTGPTLVVRLFAPGTGPAIGIAGRGRGADLAATAARGLWLPADRLAAVPEAARAAGDGAPWVVLTGSGPAGADGRPDPALLGATAQLIHELALRWGREHEPAS